MVRSDGRRDAAPDRAEREKEFDRIDAELLEAKKKAAEAGDLVKLKKLVGKRARARTSARRWARFSWAC